MANLMRTARCLSAGALLLLLIGCAAPADRADHDAAADPAAEPTAAPDRAVGRSIEPAAAPTPAPATIVEPEPVAPAPKPAPEPEPKPEPEPQPEPEIDSAPVPASEPAAAADSDDTADPATKDMAVPEAGSASAAPAPATATILLSGRVRLNGDRADVAETVLYFVPDQSTPAAEPGTFELATKDKTFIPTVLVVPRGSMIRFPNRDPILHNVFSVSAENAFDLGVYGPDSMPETTLDAVGAVNVYCNVHHDMHAHVLVLDTPWFERADSDGRFVLTDLPPGPGTLHAWHRQADAWSIRMDAPTSDSIEVVLDIVRPQLPPHLDKSGQSYQRRDRDPYR